MDGSLKRLDWNLIVAFVAVVEARGFTLAGARLGRTQPGMSNAVRRLEAHFGEPLLHRSHGAVEPTSLGRKVHLHGLRMAEEMAAIEALRPGAGEVTGAVRILVASHLGCALLDRALVTFRQRHPLTSFVIETKPSAEIARAFASGDARLGFSLTPVPGAGAIFAGQNEMAFYCGRAHPLFAADTLTMADLKGCDYASYESDQPGDGLAALAHLRLAERIGANLIAVTPNDEEMLRLLRLGLCFGALSPQHAAPLVAAGELRQLPPYADLPAFAIHFSFARVGLSPAEAAFVATVEALSLPS